MYLAGLGQREEFRRQDRAVTDGVAREKHQVEQIVLSERDGADCSPLSLGIPFSNHSGTAGRVPSGTPHFSTFIPMFKVSRETSLCPE